MWRSARPVRGAVFAGQNTLSGPLTVEAGMLTSPPGLVGHGPGYRLDACSPNADLADGSNVTVGRTPRAPALFATTNDLNRPSTMPRSAAAAPFRAAARADACSVRA